MAVGLYFPQLFHKFRADLAIDPVRLRNRIVHGYASVDVDILVAAAQDDLPTLLDGLRSMAAELSDSDE